ncbi:isoprenyl transferase [Thermoanaerobacterium sp. DL9XJH110]|uniref:isoprenyl transferase n=1 Tax=Thermoanaerobacterium sp. DL9XJH110 TaxID=3386643 RepID=UPI003BB73B7B
MDSTGLDLGKIKKDKLPRHIAIIMDGNGRWARKKGLPRIAGHWAGAEVLRDIVKFCSELDIQVLSVFAFSTENWKRPPEEVNTILNLLVYYLKKETAELHRNNVKIMITGEINDLPPRIIDEIDRCMKLTRDNTGLILNILLNYGSRREIVKACRNICRDAMCGKITADEINEDLFKKYLFTGDIPDPDLLIRPSGELRISNFLLWQIAYAELWFTEVYWPDFRREDLYRALLDFQKRDRRFGGLK